MPFDGLVTRKVCEEFNEILLYGKIDKITAPKKDEIILFIRNNRNTYKLLLCINAENARAHITNETNLSNPIRPFNFCMVLRKYLLGAKLISISQVENDRIINFTFENSNELGDKEIKTLIIEIMGKYSNIILVTEKGNIIDSFKHIDFEISSVREVMPGRSYILPQNQGKLNPFLVSETEFNTKIKENPNLSANFIGLSSELNKENLFTYNEFNNFINKKSNPVIFENNKDFYFTPLSSYKETILFNSISDAIDTYYIKKIEQQNLKNKKNHLLVVVSDLEKKTQKKLSIVNEKLKTTSEMEELKIKGELLSANLYRIKPYSTEITVENYYNNTTTTISLNSNLTPSENVQKIFKKYTKLKNTKIACNSQQTDLTNELNYIETLKFEIESQTNILDLDEIEEELIKEGFIKKQNTKKKIEKPSYMRFNYNGFDILVGKNNIQNDNLTFSVAHKTDLWFHVKNAPGSHTILKTNNNSDMSSDVLEFSASLAAYYSKLKNSPKVEIDFTEVKNVKKIPGAKPGMVIYENYKTIYISPNDGYSYLHQ